MLAPEPIRLPDVYADVRAIAQALNVPDRAAPVVDAMQRHLRGRPPSPSRPRLLVEWWPKPVIAPGRDSWVTDLIELAAGCNPLENEPCKSRPLGNDEVVALQPDAVVIAWCGVPFAKYRREVVERRPGSERLRAVRDGRVFAIPEAYLGRPGPRLTHGLDELVRVVEACQLAANPEVRFD